MKQSIKKSRNPDTPFNFLFLIALFLLVFSSCSEPRSEAKNEEKNEASYPNFGKYNPDNYQNIVVKHYKDKRLTETASKYSYLTPSGKVDVLVSKTLFEYDKKDSLSQTQRFVFGKNYNAVDTVTEQYKYIVNDNLQGKYQFNSEGDTLMIFEKRYLDKYKDNVKIVKLMYKHFNYAIPDKVTNFIEVYSNSKLRNIFEIGEEQDTLTTEYFIYNDNEKVNFNYKLDLNNDTIKSMTYFYDNSRLQFVKGYTKNIKSDLTETYDDKSRVISSTYFNELEGDTVKFEFKYNEKDLLEVTHWDYSNFAERK